MTADPLAEVVARARYEAWRVRNGLLDETMPWESIEPEARSEAISDATAALAVARPAIHAEAMQEAASLAERLNEPIVAAAIRALISR